MALGLKGICVEIATTVPLSAFVARQVQMIITKEVTITVTIWAKKPCGLMGPG